ncbi:uncharacterized protein LOC144134786 isoform X2 [Amblyomma americanum]
MLLLKIAVTSFFFALVAGQVNPKHPHEPIRAFETIRNLKHVFAVFTSSDSPKFKCLVSDAVRFDPIHMVATYVWTFKGLDGTEKKTSSFDISPGSAPDQLTFYTNNDFTTPYTAYYNYSNYVNCLVAIIPYEGEDLCMLWADRTVAASIPKDCEEQYEGTCEVSFPDYDQDICDVAEK